jgi:hypothetical protein
MSHEKKWWDLQLETKPDFDMAMKRVYAWYEGEIIDRPPVRFSAHNSFVCEKYSNRSWKNNEEKWFDVEFQVESFVESIKGKKFLAETFPVYWPNLGPNVYAAFYGCELVFEEVTSWAMPCLTSLEDADALYLNIQNKYYRKLEEITEYALSVCTGKFMVGYTDLHPGLDCVAAWRGTQKLLLDFYDDPDGVKKAAVKSIEDFQRIYDYFDAMLKKRNQLSVTWMGIPSFGKMHIPSCDFSSMISENHFIEFCLPILEKEVKLMDHNIFHVDGKGVARHSDVILGISEIKAIQWVQGEGESKPIMQWIPYIKKIRNAGKSIVVDIDKNELESFISEMEPEGVFLCISSDNEEEQKEILKRVEKW